MNYISYLLHKLKRKDLQVFVIIISVLLTYANIFGNGFAWDDKDTVINWEAKQEWSSIPRFILGETPPTHGGNYRPVRNILYIIDDKIWGKNPFGYHLQSIGIEMSTSILVYLITRRLTKDAYFPFVVALLFALHPIHVEAVTWITSSMDMFGIVFMFLSVYLYIRLSEDPRYRIALACGAILFAFLAFGTNEVTLTLPGLLFLVDIYFLYPGQSIWKRFGRNIPFAIVLVVYLAMRTFLAHAGARAGFLLGHPSVQFFVMLKAFLRYLHVLLIPLGLTINHSLGSGISSWVVEMERASLSTKQVMYSLSLFQLESIAAITIIFFSLCVAITFRKKNPILSFAILWFFVSFLTTLNIIPTEAIMVERFAYVPSYGFLLLITTLFTQVLPLTSGPLKSSKQQFAWIALICIVLAYSVLSSQRNLDWKDDVTLWTRTVAVNPNAVLARIYLGNYYLSQNRMDAGLYQYQQAYKTNPDYPEIRTTLGLLYDSKGDHAKAVELLLRSTEHPVNEFERLIILANAYRQLGKYELALRAYTGALQIAPSDTSILNNIGAVYALSGEYSLARQAFEKALQINPSLESAKQNLNKLQELH